MTHDLDHPCSDPAWHDDLPPGATVGEGVGVIVDELTAEYVAAVARRDAMPTYGRATRDRARWSEALIHGTARRRTLVGATQLGRMMTTAGDDELTAAAARYGIVPDLSEPGTDPGITGEPIGRMLANVNVWASIQRARRHRATDHFATDQPYYETSDAFDERELLAGRIPPGWTFAGHGSFVGRTRYHRHGRSLGRRDRGLSHVIPERYR